MEFKQYAVELNGLTPLIMHSDNLEWTQFVEEWRKDPANKKLQVKGDDRSPPFVWIGYLYVENGKVVLPSDNLMTLLREGGAQVSSTGRSTFKKTTQSGIVVDQSSWPLRVDGHTIDYNKIEPLVHERRFEEHEKRAKELGFSLFVKRAKIGSSKHVRVRPRFDNWSAAGTLTVLDQTITSKILEQILRFGGAYTGLCDWRPGSPSKPGQFGRFEVTVEEL